MSSVIYRTPPIPMDAKRGEAIRVGDKVGIVCGGDLGIVRVALRVEGRWAKIVDVSNVYTNAEPLGVAPFNEVVAMGKVLGLRMEANLSTDAWHSAVSSNPRGAYLGQI